MQIHFGVLRNVSSVMYGQARPDTGYDIIGGRISITELAGLLGLMEKRCALPRTLLYSVNPSDNAGIAALCGAFQTDSEGGMPRVMQGSAWWFNDNNSGMRDQMINLANMSAFVCFAGMLTDSELLSYYATNIPPHTLRYRRRARWKEANIRRLRFARRTFIMNICLQQH